MIYNASVIFVRNIEISKAFYTGLLGCTIEHDFGKNIIFNNGLAIWQIQDEIIQEEYGEDVVKKYLPGLQLKKPPKKKSK